MTAVLEIRLFGGLEIHRGGAPIGSFISSKAPALLAYLAVTGRTHQRETLAALLWSDMSDADAKNNLRQTLSNLRKVADPHVLITRDTAAFNTAVPHTLDTAQFEHHLQTGRTSGNSRFTHLSEAAALYQGDFLAGFFVRDAPEFEEWVLAQRVRFRELALHTLHTLTEIHLSRGEYGRAIDYATRLLTLDAWREEAHRQLMLAQARSGQRSAALTQYETCCRLLAEALGVTPSAETTALFTRIQAAGDVPPHNLPPQPTPFVGRTEELAHIQTLLLNPQCRWLTLAGTGGMGKTRLALQAAERAYKHGLFLNGVIFVPLAGVNSVTLLVTAVANAINLQFSGSQDPATQLLAHLQDKEMLLLLDNFDHLLEETAWPIQLLHRAPGVKLLVTSREIIHIQWEWTLSVEGLTVPPADELTTSNNFTAVQLFVSRLHTIRPTFSLTDETMPAVVRICQLVGGMPLALELAAAAGRHYNCIDIAAAIAHNLDFLTSHYRDTPPRQRSLRAVFDYSWEQLTAVDQTIFAELGVFEDGFTLEAAEQVAGATAAALALLVDKSLLQRQSTGRYQFHETIRQYAVSRLKESGDEIAQAAYQRHADYFIQLSTQAEAEFHGPDQSVWLARLDAEQNNFRASLDWSFTYGLMQLFAEMSGSLWQYWYIRSRYQEGLNRLSKAFPFLHDIPTQIQSKILRGAGVFATQLGEYEKAVDLLSQSLALQRQFGGPKEIGLAINSVAVVLQAQGKLSEAIDLYHEGLTIQRQTGDQIGMAQTLQNLGAAAIDQGEYAYAQQVSTESLALFRQLQLKWGIAYASINLALAYLRQGMLLQARLHIMEGIHLCREIESRDSVAECLEVLAGIEQGAGNAPLAVQLLAKADLLRAEVGAPRQAGSEVDYQRLTAVLLEQVGVTQFSTLRETGQNQPLEKLISDQL